MRGVVGVDFGKMKGKRVGWIREGSMCPVTVVRDTDKAVGSAVGGVAVDGKEDDHWQGKSAGGRWQSCP